MRKYLLTAAMTGLCLIAVTACEQKSNDNNTNGDSATVQTTAQDNTSAVTPPVATDTSTSSQATQSQDSSTTAPAMNNAPLSVMWSLTLTICRFSWKTFSRKPVFSLTPSHNPSPPLNFFLLKSKLKHATNAFHVLNGHSGYRYFPLKNKGFKRGNHAVAKNAYRK